MDHGEANARSLGLLRIWIFGLLFWEVTRTPIQQLAYLPYEAFQAPGVLKLVPRGLWPALLTLKCLWVLRIGLALCLASVVVGLLPTRVTCWLAWGGMVVHQAVLRGFSGHMNHAEMALLYVSFVISWFPVFDGLSLRAPRTRASDPRVHRAAFLFSAALLSATYFFTGVVRLCKGPQIFLDSTMQQLTIARALVLSEFGDGATVYARTEPFAAFRLPSHLLGAGFFGATVMEVLFPLVLVSRRWRNVLVPLMTAFHLSTGYLVGAAFYYNVCLFVLFADRAFHRVAEWIAVRFARSSPVR